MSGAAPTAGLAAFLLDDTDVSGLTDGRVFRPKIPQRELPSMPRACVIVTPAGGYLQFGDSYLPIGDPRLDVRCYGSTPLEGQNIARAVLNACKRMRPGVWAGCMLYSANVSAGVMALIDLGTLWDFSLVTFVVLCGEESAD